MLEFFNVGVVGSDPVFFGVVEAAQARGDFAVLAERQRRALRVHLGADVAAGLQRFGKLVTESF